MNLFLLFPHNCLRLEYALWRYTYFYRTFMVPSYLLPENSISTRNLIDMIVNITLWSNLNHVKLVTL